MQPVLIWFRRNLRLSDNAALIAAADSGCPVIPVYILDEQDIGGASRWWLHHSLTSLDRDLRQMGSSLVLCSGAPDKVLAEIAEQVGATALHYTRRYEPISRCQEDEVQTALAEAVEVHVFDDGYLHNPETVATLTGHPIACSRRSGGPQVPSAIRRFHCPCQSQYRSPATRSYRCGWRN